MSPSGCTYRLLGFEVSPRSAHVIEGGDLGETLRFTANAGENMTLCWIALNRRIILVSYAW